jgi:hypothetical protein
VHVGLGVERTVQLALEGYIALVDRRLAELVGKQAVVGLDGRCVVEPAVGPADSDNRSASGTRSSLIASALDPVFFEAGRNELAIYRIHQMWRNSTVGAEHSKSTVWRLCSSCAMLLVSCECQAARRDRYPMSGDHRFWRCLYGSDILSAWPFKETFQNCLPRPVWFVHSWWGSAVHSKLHLLRHLSRLCVLYRAGEAYGGQQHSADVKSAGSAGSRV